MDRFGLLALPHATPVLPPPPPPPLIPPDPPVSVNFIAMLSISTSAGGGTSAADSAAEKAEEERKRHRQEGSDSDYDAGRRPRRRRVRFEDNADEGSLGGDEGEPSAARANKDLRSIIKTRRAAAPDLRHRLVNAASPEQRAAARAAADAAQGKTTFVVGLQLTTSLRAALAPLGHHRLHAAAYYPLLPLDDSEDARREATAAAALQVHDRLLEIRSAELRPAPAPTPLSNPKMLGGVLLAPPPFLSTVDADGRNQAVERVWERLLVILQGQGFAARIQVKNHPGAYLIRLLHLQDDPLRGMFIGKRRLTVGAIVLLAPFVSTLTVSSPDREPALGEAADTASSSSAAAAAVIAAAAASAGDLTVHALTRAAAAAVAGASVSAAASDRTLAAPRAARSRSPPPRPRAPAAESQPPADPAPPPLQRPSPPPPVAPETAQRLQTLEEHGEQRDETALVGGQDIPLSFRVAAAGSGRLGESSLLTVDDAALIAAAASPSPPSAVLPSPTSGPLLVPPPLDLPVNAVYSISSHHRTSTAASLYFDPFRTKLHFLRQGEGDAPPDRPDGTNPGWDAAKRAVDEGEDRVFSVDRAAMLDTGCSFYLVVYEEMVRRLAQKGIRFHRTEYRATTAGLAQLAVHLSDPITLFIEGEEGQPLVIYNLCLATLPGVKGSHIIMGTPLLAYLHMTLQLSGPGPNQYAIFGRPSVDSCRLKLPLKPIDYSEMMVVPGIHALQRPAALEPAPGSPSSAPRSPAPTPGGRLLARLQPPLRRLAAARLGYLPLTCATAHQRGKDMSAVLSLGLAAFVAQECADRQRLYLPDGFLRQILSYAHLQPLAYSSVQQVFEAVTSDQYFSQTQPEAALQRIALFCHDLLAGLDLTTYDAPSHRDWQPLDKMARNLSMVKPQVLSATFDPLELLYLHEVAFGKVHRLDGFAEVYVQFLRELSVALLGGH